MIHLTRNQLMKILESVLISLDEKDPNNKLVSTIDLGLNLINRKSGLLVSELCRIPGTSISKDDYFEEFEKLELSEQAVILIKNYV